MQAGARKHPSTFKTRQLDKPGHEADLRPRPQFQAPGYAGVLGYSYISTGSVVGLQGSAKLLDYAATKGAIHAFTKSLAQSLLERGIRVNAATPAPVWTPLNPADGGASDVQHFGQQADLGRAAQPEELSPAYVFLASPVCASYVTGIVLPVTGSVGAI